MEGDDQEVLLVVLGAGASFDCLPGGMHKARTVESPGLPTLRLRDARPPLTQALTQAAPLPNWALGRWPGAQPVISRLRRVLGTGTDAVVSLEQALADLAEEAGQRPELARAMLATQFFMADMIWAASTYMLSPGLNGGLTNYVDLVDMLLTWVARHPHCRRVVVVSFNYDPLFETAVESTLGVKITLDDPAPDPRITVLKPHGSARWGWGAERYQGRVSGAADDRRRFISDSLDLMHPDRSRPPQMVDAPEFAGGIAQSSVVPMVPAIALPLASKADFIWSRSQEEAFAALRARVTRVLTIGWRGMEPHFTSLLGDKVKECATGLVVTGNALTEIAEAEASDVMKRLSSLTDSSLGNWGGYPWGFRSLVSHPEKLLNFLEAPGHP